MEKIYVQIDDERIEATGNLLDKILADRELAAKIQAEESATKATLEAKKQEVLAKLGLTSEEVAALLA